MPAGARRWAVLPTDRVERWDGDGSADGWRAVTIPEAWAHRVGTHGGLTHLRWKESKADTDWRSLTLAGFWELAQSVGAGLIAAGLRERECVSVIGSNAPEWFAAAHGGILGGGLSAGIYPTSSAAGVEYVLQHSRSRVLFVDSRAQLDKALAVAPRCPALRRVVVWGPDAEACAGAGGGLALPWHALVAAGGSAGAGAARRRQAAMRPGDACYLSYTSGTTGPPKAVMMSHDNILFAFFSIFRFQSAGLQLGRDERAISYMPLSHMAGAYELFAFLAHPEEVHMCTHFAFPDAMQGSLLQTLQEVQPTYFLAVPRMWQKLEGSLREAMRLDPALGKAGRRAALRAVGLGDTKVAWTGAAPTPEETVAFFESLGLRIMEGYGMTENCAMATRTNAANQMRGTIGVPVAPGSVRVLPGTGEIVVRHRAVMMGYMNDAEKTAEAIGDGGWLHTGDVGAAVSEDPDGFYRITGRIKELIITAGGENIPPVLIEGQLRELLPQVSNVVVVGDRQKMLVALFTLLQEPDAGGGGGTGRLAAAAAAVDPAAPTVAAAQRSTAWRALIAGAVAEYNAKHAASRAQSVRAWAILDSEFSPTGAEPELTPTLKLRRDAVHRKYAATIRRLYGPDFQPAPWAQPAPRM